MSHIPRAMTIATTDSGGGAGVQADLKTFTVFGCYGTSAITALTAQNTQGVQGIHSIPPAFLEEQINSVMEDIGTDVIKIGMLHSVEVIRTVRDALARFEVPQVVLDPVMVAKSGDRLLQKEAEEPLREELLPYASLLTPNLLEAEVLLGRELADEAPERIAQEIAGYGPRAVLLKGGHSGGSKSDDLLWDGEKEAARTYHAERIDTPNAHGTGCTLSSAIAAEMARGKSLEEAVEGGKRFISEALRSGLSQRIGKGKGPVDHLYDIRRS